MGRKKRPFYRIVVADSRTRSRSGYFIDKIGFYDPLTVPASVKIDEAKALTWLNNGAIPTDTARTLLSKQGIMQKFHTAKLEKKD